MPSKATLLFIQNNRNESTSTLALKHHPEDVDMQYALEQISGWQAAKKKLPTWAATDGIIYPPHISMEQCSSEQTAKYKKELAARLLNNDVDGTFVDLTGGFGVDFSYIAKNFSHSVYVEQRQNLCILAQNNMPLFELKNVEVRCDDCVEYLKSMPHVSMIFIDPARRDINGERTFAISDCTPDIIAIKELLLDKADWIVVKLSPMLDWHKAVDDLNCVAEVHIVSVKNECKELLLVLHKDSGKKTSNVYCADCSGKSTSGADWTMMRFCLSDAESSACATFGSPVEGIFMYEPNSSVMKASCFKKLSSLRSMPMISENSHLYLSECLDKTFPGRCFKVKKVTGLGKKELRKALSGIEKANLAVRNFPMSVAELRKKLKLKDGGSIYIFATTLQDDSHVLVITEKA